MTCAAAAPVAHDHRDLAVLAAAHVLALVDVKRRLAEAAGAQHLLLQLALGLELRHLIDKIRAKTKVVSGLFSQVLGNGFYRLEQSLSNKAVGQQTEAKDEKQGDCHHVVDRLISFLRSQ